VKKSLLVKIALALLAVSAFAFLFMRSIEDTRSAPYTVDRAHLRRPWTLALEPATASNHPVLVLRPPPELAAGIFKQIFSRAMESLNSPMMPSVPVVLRRRVRCYRRWSNDPGRDARRRCRCRS
jgi:hypothetical protein